MYARLSQSGMLRLLHQTVGHIRRTADQDLMVRGTLEAVGSNFRLDRAAILLIDRENHEIVIRAEHAREDMRPLGECHYQLHPHSEWYRLLAEGRPVPLTEIQLETVSPSAAPDLGQFVLDSASKSVIAFPVAAEGQLIGCLTMHYCLEAQPFSEELLEAGEILSEELALGISRCRLSEEMNLHSRVFVDSHLPLIVLQQDSGKILNANQACRDLLAPDRENLNGLYLLELFADSDSRRLKDAFVSLRSRAGLVTLCGLAARTASGGPLLLDLALSSLPPDGAGTIVAVLLAGGSEQKGGRRAGSADWQEGERVAKIEELVATLSKQLNWERIARHVISSVHTTLDRDAVLQTAADSLGRALVASRCLIVRTDGPASPVVTHEYVQPDISPLGLGRTSQFPLGAIACFKAKSCAVQDLSAPSKRMDLPSQDLSYLLESGIYAIAGTPISHHGSTYGVVIVVQNEHPRQWTAQEMEFMETIAMQVAIALNHAQSYAQVKDQLFNMSLIGNLTQQLTNALDMATRAGPQPEKEEPGRQPGASPPLSLRELEVLKLIASGLANREIAQRLFLTESTVELHASRIRKKLKLKSRTALVKYACDNHLV